MHTISQRPPILAPKLHVNSEELRKYALTIADTTEAVDEYIEGEDLPNHHEDFPMKPNTVFNPSGFNLRKQFSL